MSKFIEWAFYGSVPEGLTPEEAYKCYQIYCELFKCETMKKFAFIEEWNEYVL